MAIPPVTFNLTDTLSHLLTSIEGGRADMKAAMALLVAFNDTKERHASALKRLQDFAGSGSLANEELAGHRSEVEMLSKQLDDQWRSYKSATAFLVPFVDALNLLLQRLPVEWGKYRDALAELRVGVDGAWMEPPTSPDLVTLELRLSEMLNRARSEKNRAGTQQVQVRPLPMPNDAAWRDIRIRLLSDHQFQVFVRESQLPPTSFEEAGFADRRGRQAKKPIAAWTTLLELARNEGRLTRPSMSDSPGMRSAFEKRIEEIRHRFKMLFGFPDDPFHPFADDEYRLIPKISSNI